MDPSVYDGLLDFMDHIDSFSPLLSEKGSISNLLMRTTLNIIPLRKFTSLKKFLVDLTYIWHGFRICMTLSYSAWSKFPADSDYFENSRGGGVPHPHPDPPCRSADA